ncbi:MAG: DUF397 domain-containing protein [Micromonosporaceae bacterium]|nr:DUF397 domain-containing protein [Micromonosporaceae bacterium]
MTPDLTRAEWRKSTRSQQSGACVELAVTPAVVGVRDSKDRAAGHLEFARTEWETFLAEAKAGEFDL